MRRRWAGPWRLIQGQWVRPYWQTYVFQPATSSASTYTLPIFHTQGASTMVGFKQVQKQWKQGPHVAA